MGSKLGQVTELAPLWCETWMPTSRGLEKGLGPTGPVHKAFVKDVSDGRMGLRAPLCCFLAVWPTDTLVLLQVSWRIVSASSCTGHLCFNYSAPVPLCLLKLLIFA